MIHYAHITFSNATNTTPERIRVRLPGIYRHITIPYGAEIPPAATTEEVCLFVVARALKRAGKQAVVETHTYGVLPDGSYVIGIQYQEAP